MDSNPYESSSSSPATDETLVPNPQRADRPIYTVTKTFIGFVSIPCWIGSLFFTFVGATAMLESDFPTHIMLTTASGTTALTFLVAQLFTGRCFTSIITLILFGCVAVIASAADHAYRQVQIDSLGADCGLAGVAHFVFSVFWLSTYICVPAILLLRSIEMSRLPVTRAAA